MVLVGFILRRFRGPFSSAEIPRAHPGPPIPKGLSKTVVASWILAQSVQQRQCWDGLMSKGSRSCFLATCFVWRPGVPRPKHHICSGKPWFLGPRCPRPPNKHLANKPLRDPLGYVRILDFSFLEPNRTWSRNGIRVGLPSWFLLIYAVVLKPEPFVMVPRPTLAENRPKHRPRLKFRF